MRPSLFLFLLCCTLFSACELEYTNKMEQSSKFVHSFWLMLIAGFSSGILFFIWKNQQGNEGVGWKKFWSAILEIGDETKDQGILALSLAIFCWWVSGVVSLGPEENQWVIFAMSVCSSLNSCFLLLFLKHLDKEDLPHWHPSSILSPLAIWYLSIGFMLAATLSIFLAGGQKNLILFPDLIFSVFTIIALGFDFFHLFRKRMNSSWVGFLAIVPVLVTLLAELAQYFYIKEGEAKSETLVYAKQTLFFAYKPLLIISYFLLIYTWQQKRIKRGAIPNGAVLSGLSIDEMKSRRSQYPNFNEGEGYNWLIIEALAEGKNAPQIAELLGKKYNYGINKDGVSDRISAIAKAFRLEGESQMRIVIFAIQNGLIRVDDIKLSMDK